MLYLNIYVHENFGKKREKRRKREEEKEEKKREEGHYTPITRDLKRE